mgnify:CR=1 FL=1
MDQFELLENTFTPEQLFLIAATSVPEIDIDYKNQVIEFNTTKTYNREEIGVFIDQSRIKIQEYKDSITDQNLEENQNVTANILWIQDKLQMLEQYLNN